MFKEIQQIGLGNWINMYQTELSVFFVLALIILYYILKRCVNAKSVSLISTILLISYTAAIIFKTVVSRSGTTYGFEAEFLWSYRKWLSGDTAIFNQIFLNILLYIPLGCFGVNSFRERLSIALTLLIGLAVTVTTELSQYIFKVGLFEYDDILNNMIGTVLGIIAAVLINSIHKKENHQS